MDFEETASTGGMRVEYGIPPENGTDGNDE
jgi:hypothetical protein